MRSLFRSTIAAVALVAAAGALSACNTMAGAGEDMQQGGSALTNSAVKHGANPTDNSGTSTTTDQSAPAAAAPSQ